MDPVATLKGSVCVLKTVSVVALVAAFAVGWNLSGLAASPTHVASLLTAWYSLNLQCRGGADDDSQTVKACDRRSEIDAKLKRAGCSYRMGDRWVCKGYTPRCTYSAQGDMTVCR
jgi:hypothetical protein